MKKSLFSEFPPVSKTDWEARIMEDLNGAEYEKKLVWQSLEGIRVKPYYRQEDVEDKPYLNVMPGEFPFTRGNNPVKLKWKIRQDILVEDPSSANRKALFLQERGVTSIGFIIQENTVTKQDELDTLLKDLLRDDIEIHFNNPYHPVNFFSMLYSSLKKSGINQTTVRGSYEFDPLCHLTENGRFFSTMKDDFTVLRDLITAAGGNLPEYRTVTAGGNFFSDVGASATQELAYSFAMAVDYLAFLTEMGIPAEKICKHLRINLGVGTSYFMEIAKIRAARFLWSKIAAAYGVSEEASKLLIQSVTSTWNQTQYDPYSNVLRATTASMAAVMGGTDALVVTPFNLPCGPATEFTERISRNIQIIIGEEAYLGNVTDPAGGSYYIENLTDALIDEAWKIFLRIEAEGGYLEALKKGIIQKDIEDAAEKRRNAIANRREVLIGTNQYPNYNEVILNDLKIRNETDQNSTETMEVIPIKKTRASQGFEALRLATEKHSYRPVAFMLTIGDLTMRRARANFSCNFFASAGYNVIDNNGFAGVGEGIQAAREANADIVVLCSSDGEYAVYASEAVRILKNDKIIVIAGAPKNIDELRSIGIENFIHIRSNVLDTLKEYHKKLGISL